MLKRAGCAVIFLLLSSTIIVYADQDSDRKSELEKVKDDYRKWDDGIKELRRWYKEDTDNLREAICREDEEDIEEKAKDVADRISRRLSPKYDDLAREADRLKDRFEALRTGNTKDEAEKYKERVDRRIRSVRNAVDNNGLGKGAGNPKIRARIEYGKRQHSNISGCAETEVTIESSYCSDSKKKGGCRIDCVRVSGSTCIIVELKPNNSAAENQGRTQLERYEKGVQQKYQAVKASGLTGKSEVFKKCMGDNKLNLETKLETYNFCPVSAEDVTDQLASEPSD